MGNQCACYQKEDEVELATREQLLRLHRIELDSSFANEVEKQIQELAKKETVDPLEKKIYTMDKLGTTESSNIKKVFFP